MPSAMRKNVSQEKLVASKYTYTKVVQDFLEIPSTPVGGYDDFVDSLGRALRAVDSPVVNNPIMLWIDAPPGSGAEFYLARAAYKNKRVLRSPGAETLDGTGAPKKGSTKNVFLAINPQDAPFYDLLDVYQNMSPGSKTVFVIVCDAYSTDEESGDDLKSVLSTSLSYSNIQCHELAMRQPRPEDYVESLRSLYAPHEKDVKKFGSAGLVIESMGYAAFSLGLGIRLVPRALERAAIAYSGKRNPRMKDILQSSKDLAGHKE